MPGTRVWLPSPALSGDLRKFVKTVIPCEPRPSTMMQTVAGKRGAIRISGV
jgi:hypothetical protein